MTAVTAAAADTAMEMMTCSVCGLEVAYEVYSTSHPRLEPQVEWTEAAYVRSDPWRQQGRRPFAVGSRCSQCQRNVCRAKECCVFYAKSFCIRCARANRDAFPAAVQRELT